MSTAAMASKIELVGACSINVVMAASIEHTGLEWFGDCPGRLFGDSPGDLGIVRGFIRASRRQAP
jgi:hypothetical protein